MIEPERMISLALALTLTGLAPEAQEKLTLEARKVLGVPYVLGGRLRKSGDGLDCQGLVFFALQSISKCGWRSWSVMPTTSVKGELGLPVEGASPVASSNIDVTKLQAGDIIWFVDPLQN